MSEDNNTNIEVQVAPTSSHESEAGALPGALTLINHGVEMVKERFYALVVSLLVSVVALVPFSIVVAPLEAVPLNQVSPTTWGWIVAAFIWLLAVSIINNAAVVYLFAESAERSYRDAFLWALKKFWVYTWVGALTSLVLITATTALVIPGIILSMYFVFSLMTVVREDRSGFAVLVRSTDLVHGAFWKILGRFIVAIVLVILASVVLGIILKAFEVLGSGGLFFSDLVAGVVQTMFGWIVIAMIVQLYTLRVAAKPHFEAADHKNIFLSYKIMAVIGVLIPLAVSTIFASFVFSVSQQYLYNLQQIQADVEHEMFIEEMREQRGLYEE